MSWELFHFSGLDKGEAQCLPVACGWCKHSNDSDAVVPDLYTYCTLAGGFYNGKLMERTSRCARWEARDHA